MHVLELADRAVDNQLSHTVEVLDRMATTYDEQFEKIEEFKPKLLEAIQQNVGGSETGDLDLTLILRACGQIDSSFDEKYGGFEKEPKFPHPAALELLRDAIAYTDNEQRDKQLLAQGWRKVFRNND